MTSAYRQFIFDSYALDTDRHTLTMHYMFDDSVRFTETLHFDFPFVSFDPEYADIACQNVFFMSGVSYYKAYLAPEIIVRNGYLDESAAEFYSQTYQHGLGEFFFINSLDPRLPISFPTSTGTTAHSLSVSQSKTGLLIGIGGGKDSLVSVELLRKSHDRLATWSVGHRSQLSPLIERIGLPHYWVERQWDYALLDHNARGALNGHIPISAILASIGTLVAVLSGMTDVIVSNEQSANEPTLQYRGVAINHQYSKSQAFEQAYQMQLTQMFGSHVRYYSLLRPFSELRIAELFAQLGFDTYEDVFSSCNRAFTHDNTHIFWDGTCPKCAFVFLALTPFVPRHKLEKLFDGRNLLLSPALEPTYRQLLGIEGDKPLECVGEIKESRTAMRLAAQIYPELSGRYQFDIPADYDYARQSDDAMPPDIRHFISRQITHLPR